MMGRRGDTGYEEGELELEDGEAASGGGSFDPDAYTHIDEKIEKFLGHFRTLFEGEITAEKLGPLYGKSGSFLPTYQRPPLAFSQYRSNVNPPNHGSASRLPYLPMETVQKHDLLIKTELGSSRKNDYRQISNESNGSPSQLMLGRAVNGFEQKAPKIRIKVNSNKSLERSTADIYSGLGLDISPSSSMEDNLDGTSGAPMPEVLPDESPSTIFGIMTCHFIPGGHLLSPLTGNILDLRQKPRAMVKNEAPEFHDAEAELHKDWGQSTSDTLDNKDKSATEIKSDENKDMIPNFKISKCRANKPCPMNKGTKPQLQDVSDDTGSNFLPTAIKTEHSVKESVNFVDVIADQIKGSKNGSSKRHITDKNKDIKKEPSLDHGFSCKIKYDSEEYNGQPCTSSGHLQNSPNKTTLLERDEEKVVHVKEELSHYKSKETGSLYSAESMDIMAGNVDRSSSGLIKGKKKKVSSLQAALSTKKLKFKAQKQLNDDIDTKSYGEDENYALDRRIDLLNSYPKDKSLKLEKKTILSGEIGNKSGVGNGGDLKISTCFDDKSDPLQLVCRNGITEPSTALTAPEPIVINEEWVCCDKCENWRLLPYGMNPNVLPKKWRCSMLTWLPGMNSCKITEDETTAALRALYMVPAPENNSKDNHDNAVTSIGVDMAPTFQGNIQSSRLGKLKGSHGGANVANTLDLADMSKVSKKLYARSSKKPDGSDCFPKLRENPKLAESSDKGEVGAKDQSHPMRNSIGVDHDNLRASKKMKKEPNGPVMKHRRSDSEISKSSPNERLKNMQKHGGISSGMGKYGSSSQGKHSHGEDKGFSDGVIKMSDTEYSAIPDSSIKKRKLKQRQSSQHDLDPWHKNTETNGITKQSINEGNIVKKKPRLELKSSKTGRTVTHSKSTVPVVDDDSISASKECLSEQHQENTCFQHPLLSKSSTRRNICHGQTSTVATSSSSKVSNSDKCKADFLETRASPVESVSSSPLRTSDKNPLDRNRIYSLAIAENMHSQELGKNGSSNSNRTYDLGSDYDQAKAHSGCFNGDMGHRVQKDKDLLKDKQELMNACLIKKGSGLGIKNVQLNPEDHDPKQPTGCQNGKALPHFDSNQSDHANLTYGNIKSDKWNIPHKDWKINPSTVKGSKQQPSLNSASNGDASYKAKQIEKAVIENLETRKQVTTNGHASNLTDASILLKEARDLKHLSKHLKEKGDDFESTSMCFEAGLKFLHVASLWEAPNLSSKQGDSVQAMKLYSETGNLCGFCAQEFERLKKTANAALAYKCVEVAYMKAAFFKHPGVIKDRLAVQAASLMVPPAESPSSSASDIDNLNNQNTVAKAVSARGVCSPQIASNPISRNNHHLVALLSYAENINNAFEGTRKSQNSFSAYLSGIGKNKVDAIALVREVLDFSFHNVKGLLQLIRHSLVSINHETVK